MFRKILSYLTLLLLLFLSNSSGNSGSQSTGKSADERTESLERMAVATGQVTIDRTNLIATVKEILAARQPTSGAVDQK